jgi:hypothetical protein
MEGAATTVYAQGGRGNSRLAAWEGERTVTFTMEDALISPAGFMILSGAGLIEASTNNVLKVHTTEQTDKIVVSSDGQKTTAVSVIVSEKPYIGAEGGAKEDLIYVMRLENGEVATEPYIPVHAIDPVAFENGLWETVNAEDATGYRLQLKTTDDLAVFQAGDVVLVDYYVERDSDAQQIEITPDKFGGNYYLEASTLFRTTDGVDMPAEFIIPNCKIQSNFTFTMASSGDPSTFTFTMDAFPDYTRFDRTKKVLAAIQIINTGNADAVTARTRTVHDADHEKFLQ